MSFKSVILFRLVISNDDKKSLPPSVTNVLRLSSIAAIDLPSSFQSPCFKLEKQTWFSLSIKKPSNDGPRRSSRKGPNVVEKMYESSTRVKSFGKLMSLGPSPFKEEIKPVVKPSENESAAFKISRLAIC